jgi:hypothetical protein
LHTCLHHLSWFLFGFSPCWVLVLVVIFMTSPSSPKTDFVWKTCCVFWLEILSVHLRDRVHTFPCVVSPLVATFPTELDSSRLELPCKSYCGSLFLVLQFLLRTVVPTLARYYRVTPCGTTAASTGPSTASPDGSLPLEVFTR